MSHRDFLWGVATSAYQSEGGYNGTGQPQTNWAGAERADDVAVSGPAAEFWTRYEEDFAACEGLGLTSFRMGIEWSRVQPTTSNGETSAPPPFDEAALDHYAAMLAAARRHRLEPVVTLHHFVHPAWLGGDPWLQGAATVEHFARFVGKTVEHLNTRLVEVHRTEPIRYYLTINEPNMLVINSYVAHQFPVGPDTSPPLEAMLRAYDTILAAHVAAYNRIHNLHGAHGWEPARVSFNTYCSDVYWLDKFLLDLLLLRDRVTRPGNEGPYLQEKAAAFEDALKQAAIVLPRKLPHLIGALAKKVIHRMGRQFFREVHLPLALAAIRDSPRERCLDYLALDYYDPFFAHLARLPHWGDLEFKSKSRQAWLMATVTSKWWDWRVLPRGLEFFCRYYSEDAGNLPVLIAENGLALRRRVDHTWHPRRDGVSRSEFLRQHVAEVRRMVDAGVPVFGYLHWSLFDNYEWGSFTPRFGLFSLDYRRSRERLPLDCAGDPAAQTYADLIKAARE